MAQKERQLQEIRKEMLTQKEDLKRLFHVEMDAGNKEHEIEIKSLHSQVIKLRKEVEKGQLDLEDATRRPHTFDFCQQVDNYTNEMEEAEKLRTELYYLRNQISCLFAPKFLGSDRKDVRASEAVIDACRDYVQNMDEMILSARNENQGLQAELELQKSRMHEEVQNDRIQLEHEHQDALLSLKQCHKMEIASQKKSLDGLQSTNFRRKDEGMSRSKTFEDTLKPNSKVDSLHELLREYPALMTNYRLQIERNIVRINEKRNISTEKEDIGQSNQMTVLKDRMDLEIAQLKTEVSDGNLLNEQQSTDFEAAKVAYKSKFEQLKTDIVDKERLINRIKSAHKAEVLSITKRIKGHCSAAYDEAVKKMKEEYLNVERRMRAKIAKETETDITSLRTKNQDQSQLINQYQIQCQSLEVH